MHLSLNVKYVLIYLLFGLLSFLCISTVTSHLMMENTVTAQASDFYQEGIWLSEQYVENYFAKQEDRKNLAAIRSHLNSLSIYLDARIHLISREGDIMLDTQSDETPKEPQKIENFNPVLPKGRYYTIGDFFGMFPE